MAAKNEAWAEMTALLCSRNFNLRNQKARERQGAQG